MYLSCDVVVATRIGCQYEPETFRHGTRYRPLRSSVLPQCQLASLVYPCQVHGFALAVPATPSVSAPAAPRTPATFFHRFIRIPPTKAGFLVGQSPQSVRNFAAGSFRSCCSPPTSERCPASCPDSAQTSP